MRLAIVLLAAVCWGAPQQPENTKGSAAARAEFDKGAAALRENDWDGAVEHYGKATQIDPDFFEAHEQYVFVSTAGPKNYNNEKLHQELEAYYLKASKDHPDKAVFRYCLGRINEYKKPDLAVQYFQEAVKVDPKFAPAWDELLITAEAQGQLGEEREFGRKAVESWPENSRYGRHAADAWMMADFASFKKASLEHIARHPEDAVSQLNYLASRARTVEDSRGVLEMIYKDHLAQGPGSLPQLFQIYLREDAAKALKLAKDVSAVAPRDQSWAQLGAYAQALLDARGMIGAGNAQGAAATLSRVTLGPRVDRRMLDIAQAEAKAAAGQADEAYQGLVKIFAAKPTDEMRAALIEIGKKAGKDTAQVNADVFAARKLTARAGIPYSTTTYPDSRPIKLDDYKGKVFLLNFWYPLCGPCRGEFPSLQVVLDKYKDRGFSIVAINIHPNENDWVMPLIKGWKLGFLPVHGGDDVMEAYKVRGAPSNFLYGPDGKIYYVPGPVSTVDARRELEMQIEGLLDQTQRPLAECLTNIEKVQRAQYAQKPAMARECLVKHPLAEVSGPDLLDLAKLYAEADEQAEAQAAIDKRLAEPGLSDEEKGEALLAIVTVAQRGTATDELRPRSIRAAAEVAGPIDRLGDSAAYQQYMVYRWLNSYYRGDSDLNGKLYRTATRLMALYPKLTAEQRKGSEVAFGLYCAYENLGDSWASKGDIAKAKATLHEGIERLAGSTFGKSLEKGLKRYDLVGEKAPVIEAPFWINAKPEGNKASNAGKVTVVEFTAHWCIPCKETYPDLRRIADQFAGRNVQILLATSLYGYFGKDHGLSPEQELALDRAYFTDEHKLTMPIAVASKSAEDANSTNYGVQSIPQFVVIDREGKVRRFLSGPEEVRLIPEILEGLLK